MTVDRHHPMSDDRYRCLYGDSEGHWLLVEAPCGLIAPPGLPVGLVPGRTTELLALGDPGHVFAHIYNHHRGHKVPVQQALADLFGQTQQAVSRWVTGASSPRLADHQWAQLVRLYFDPDRLVAFVLADGFDREEV